MNIRSHWFEVDDDENQEEEEEITKKSRRTKIDKVAGGIYICVASMPKYT